jgi:hypothetical protein
MDKIMKQCLLYITAVAFLFNVGHASAQITEITTEALGFGESRSEAVNDAIENAMGKAFGIRVDATTETYTQTSDLNVDGKSKYKFTDKFIKSVKITVNSPANNPVLGYEVVDEQKSNNEWQVKITLTYAKFIPLGNKNNRRSMIVLSTDSNTKALRDRIEQELVHSRRFNILSRDLEDSMAKEIEFLHSGQVKAQELSRLVQAKGADYMLVLGAKKQHTNTSHYNTMLGKQISTHRFIYKANARIVDFSSHEIKWSLLVDFDIQAKSEKELASKLDTELSIAANHIVTSLTSTIYPARISNISANGTRAILNRGTGAIEIGQVVTIFTKGAKIIDPQSGESLGYDELTVGKGLIVDVKPKYSVVQMPGGDLTANGQYIVRWATEPDVEKVHINDSDRVKKAKNNTQLFLQ